MLIADTFIISFSVEILLNTSSLYFSTFTTIPQSSYAVRGEVRRQIRLTSEMSINDSLLCEFLLRPL